MRHCKYNFNFLSSSGIGPRSVNSNIKAEYFQQNWGWISWLCFISFQMFSFIHSNSLLIVQSSNLLKQYLSQCVGSVGSRDHVCREWYHLHNCQYHVYIPLKTLYIHVEQQRPQYWILGMTKYYFSVITVSFVYLSSMSSFRKVAKDKIRWFRVKSISCMFNNKEDILKSKQ